MVPFSCWSLIGKGNETLQSCREAGAFRTKGDWNNGKCLQCLNAQVCTSRSRLLSVAVSSLETKVVDVDFTFTEIEATLDLVSTKGVDLIVFPELCITGYSCDLFYQQTLLELGPPGPSRCKNSFVSGCNCRFACEQGKIFNCAACLVDGEILGKCLKSTFQLWRILWKAVVCQREYCGWSWSWCLMGPSPTARTFCSTCPTWNIARLG